MASCVKSGRTTQSVHRSHARICRVEAPVGARVYGEATLAVCLAVSGPRGSSPALSTSASIAAWYVDAKTSRIATAQGRKDGNLPMSRRKNRSYRITTRRAPNAYAGSVNNLWSVAVDRRMLGNRR